MVNEFGHVSLRPAGGTKMPQWMKSVEKLTQRA
jgi:hypothetical protein